MRETPIYSYVKLKIRGKHGKDHVNEKRPKY
jgi:hypothetical protein